LEVEKSKNCPFWFSGGRGERNQELKHVQFLRVVSKTQRKNLVGFMKEPAENCEHLSGLSVTRSKITHPDNQQRFGAHF
jgi:hypothetical protein